MFQEGRLESERIVEKVPKKYFYLAVKRLFDIIVSGIALLLLWPLFLIISIIIRIDSKGPAFLKQARIGKDGEPIKIYKFRSMVDNAEALLDKLMAEDPAIYEEYT
ncbi:MAG: sugar transferase, partial [Bacilli bacterium]|nr:sugar transferase [Bacilli bacterium]